MSKLEEHCEASFIAFGQRFEALHRWLDEFAGTPDYGFRHRKKRHHQAGIEEAVRLFGESAREAARLHVIMDLKLEGWKETDHFPKDEVDYVKMGLF